MKYLTLMLFSFVLTGCAGLQKAGVSGGGVFKAGVDGVMDGLTTPHEATWGPMMLVATLTVLGGMVVLWAFRRPVIGLGMIGSGLGLGVAVEFFQEYAMLVAVGSLVAAVIAGVYIMADENRMKAIKKRAAQLFADGETDKAVELEAMADRDLARELKRKRKRETKAAKKAAKKE